MEFKLQLDQIIQSDSIFSTKLINVVETLKGIKEDQKNLVKRIFQEHLNQFINQIDQSYKVKVSYISELLQKLEEKRMEIDSMINAIQNGCADVARFEQKLKQLNLNDDKMPLSSLLTLDFMIQPNFQIQNLGFVCTTTKLPKDLMFYVSKNASTPLLQINDKISIRVQSHSSQDMNDPLLIKSLSCKIVVPDLMQHATSNDIVLSGETLTDYSIKYSYQVVHAGKHIVQIQLYGVDITDSPSSFDVLQGSSAMMEKDNDDEQTNATYSFLFEKYRRTENSKMPKSENKGDQNANVENVPSSHVKNEGATRLHSPTCNSFPPPSSTPTNILDNLFLFKSTEHSSGEMFMDSSQHSSAASKTHPEMSSAKNHVNPEDGLNSTETFRNLAPEEESLSSEACFINNETNSSGQRDSENNNDVDWEPNLESTRINSESRIFWRSDAGWMMEGKSVKAQLLWNSAKSADLHFPIGVHPTPEDNIVVCDTNHHRVVVFNNEGKLIHDFGREGRNSGEFYRPSAVVVAEDGKIFIKDDRRIQVFSPNFEYMWSCGNDCLRKAYGLAFDGHGRLVTLDVTSNSQLCFFSPVGSLITKKPFSALKPFQPESKCRFLDANENNIAVVDLGLNCVYISDFDGQLITTFGSGGKRPGQFSDPAGISIDQNRNMFIADSRNSRIQVFNLYGQFITKLEFGESPIKRPSDICLTTTGRLLVLNYTDHILSAYELV